MIQTCADDARNEEDAMISRNPVFALEMIQTWPMVGYSILMIQRRNPVFALEMIQTVNLRPDALNINFRKSQSSIRPGDDSDDLQVHGGITYTASQSSIRPGDDSDKYFAGSQLIIP